MPRKARKDGSRVLVIKGTGPREAPPLVVSKKPPGSKPVKKS